MVMHITALVTSHAEEHRPLFHYSGPVCLWVHIFLLMHLKEWTCLALSFFTVLQSIDLATSCRALT